MTTNGSSDPDRTRDDIRRTRADLVATVQALAAKTDVKARGRDRAVEMKSRARQRLADAIHAMRAQTSGTLQNARDKAGSSGLADMARSAQQRGSTLRQGTTQKVSALRSRASGTAASQWNGAAAGPIRDTAVEIRSAARRRPAILVAAVSALGVAVAVRQLRLARRRC